ncbi:MAG: HAD family phosphatase [Lachnospiraceae bacterium]|nr:HAD family phosphatase [Lachnospiraceae bacterium]
MNNGRKHIKLVAFDLDGTLLNSDKAISGGDREALLSAHAAGVELVPATGRLLMALPEEVKSLPINYCIAINGAGIYDIREGKSIARSEMPMERVIELMGYLDRLPVVYDCYMEDRGYMTFDMKDRAADYIKEPEYQKLINSFREGVPDLKAHVRNRGKSVQKVQFFVRYREDKERLKAEVMEHFPEFVFTSSSLDNIEINSRDANKGEGIKRLAEYLKLPMESTMALGDGSNDSAMLRAAGVGVAMGNAAPDVKSAADFVTGNNDSEGVRQALERWVL